MIRRKTYKIAIMNLLIFAVAIIALAIMTEAKAADFYGHKNRYKGFYWFENKESEKKDDSSYQMPTAGEANRIIEARKEKLDNARAQMIAVGLDEHAPLAAKREAIVAYKKLEAPMWQGMIDMVHASDMANISNPELQGSANESHNVYGIKLQRKLTEEKNKLAILEFAKNHDLLLFASDDCPYSNEAKPIIERFASEYQFSLDIASLDGKAGKLAESLGIKGTPTLVVVAKDGSRALEVGRSLMVISELEENMVLAAEFIEELKNKKKGDKYA